jgi:hypothetical protein
VLLAFENWGEDIKDLYEWPSRKQLNRISQFYEKYSATCFIEQWRNVISGGPRFKIFEGPLYSRSAKGTSRAPYMHEFSRGSRACSSETFLNLDSLKCHFLDFGERFYRILMVRKRHSVTYQRPWPMFLLYRLSLGAPIWPIGVGDPRVLPVWAHIVFTPLSSKKYFKIHPSQSIKLVNPYFILLGGWFETC